MERKKRLKARHGKKTGNGCGMDLGMYVKMWPTIRASDWKGCGPIGSKSHNHFVRKKYLSGVAQESEGRSGNLNPDWTEWLMGWPIGWTSLKPLAKKDFKNWESMVRNNTWWKEDPSTTGGVSRVTKKKANRTDRLKAIGNGQVPIVAAFGFENLKRILND